MLKEFRDFIMRGNILDLAVAVVIGVAFGAIVTSFVNDILMPPIGLLLGGVDFSNLFLDLSGEGYETLAAAQEAGAATINYGLFLNTVINFLIVAFAIFMVLRAVKEVRERVAAREEQAPPAPPEPSAEERLLAEIRDLLRTRQ
ncbi:MAG TPA: large conductance mechanosensitive channel protein MscL [Anaerolineales bacterium]|nr:large conductance mechanosensitive channel protein MscL [Anaerolineales bacterium]